MEEFHAIIVDKSLKSLDILNNLNVLSEKGGDWSLFKVSSTEDELFDTIRQLQSQMNDGKWYFHFYNRDGSKMIVVYKENIFETTNNPAKWSDILEYGKELGIPEEQLDFAPNRFEDEQF